MKLVIILLAALTLTKTSFAFQSAESTLRYYRLSDCTGWSNLPGSYSIYGCTFYPGSAFVPEVNSLITILNEQAKAIETLEARLKVLEEKPN